MKTSFICEIINCTEIKCLSGTPISGQKYEARIITDKYQSFLKLNALWHILLKALSENGNSVDYWDYRLKFIAGFGKEIELKTKVIFLPYSFKWDWNRNEDELYQERSELFRKSFNYITDNDIMDITEFINDYESITGKKINELINGRY